MQPPSRTLRIEPAQSWQGLNVAELWRYRELLYFFVWRDIKVRYKQTVLGGLWAIIQPVAATALFTVFFGRLGGLSKQVEGSYALFVFVRPGALDVFLERRHRWRPTALSAAATSSRRCTFRGC